MFGKGLVIGKFYPPHKGHQYLIQTGIQKCQQLYTIICKTNNQQPNAQLRNKWIKQLYPKVQTSILQDLNYDPDDSKLWAELTIKHLGFRPDVVFTSEDYGHRYCEFLNCKHILVDKERIKVPISGTLFRNNPLKYWQFISEPVRQYYAKRVVIMGPESTGKSTLCQKLAKIFDTCWVEEYGREYSQHKLVKQNKNQIQYNWESQDFINIANQQNKRQNQMSRKCNKFLLCDTNSFATSVWHLRYLNFENQNVTKIALEQKKPDLILLTTADVPFVPDGIRDGQKIRDKMFQDFEAFLKKYKFEYHILKGDYQSRMKTAVNLIKKLSPEIKQQTN